jgi:hypothetical protein
MKKKMKMKMKRKKKKLARTSPIRTNGTGLRCFPNTSLDPRWIERAAER